MSTLDDMVADVRERKSVAAQVTGLTPVGSERRPGIPDIPTVFLTNEAVQDVARDLREQARLLLEVAYGLEQMTGGEVSTLAQGAQTDADAQKAREREADAQALVRAAEAAPTPFDSMLAAKAAAAQAATFGDAEASRPVPAGWECPDHGTDNLVNLTSRKGREYAACKVAGCGQFQH